MFVWTFCEPQFLHSDSDYSLKLHFKGSTINFVCDFQLWVSSSQLQLAQQKCFFLPCRETQGDGEKSAKEESPLAGSSSDASAPAGSQEVRGGMSKPLWAKRTGRDEGVAAWISQFPVLLLGRWSTTRATQLWVSTPRTLWLPWTQTGTVAPGMEAESLPFLSFFCEPAQCIVLTS